MEEEYKRKRAISFIFLIGIYTGLLLCKGFLPANLLLIEAALLTTKTAIATLVAINLVVIIASVLFFGYFGEKFSKHRKKILVITQFGWVICFGLLAFTQTFLQFSVLFITSAVFEGAFLPIAFAMIGDFYPPKERGAKFGLINVGLILGSGGGLVFGKLLGDLIPTIGWRLAYGLGFILAFLAVTGYSIYGILPKRGKYEPELQDMKGETKYDYKITLTALKKLFKTKTVGILLISVLITGVTTTTLGTWALAYFESSQLSILGVNASLFAMIFFIFAGLGAFPGLIWGGKWGDKYFKTGKLRVRVIISLVGIISGFSCFLGFYLIPLSGGTTWEIVLSAIIILSFGFLGFFLTSLPVGNQFAIYSEVCVPEIRASANAFHGVMANIGGIVGNVLLVFSITGGAILPFHITILVIFGIIGGLLWIVPYFTYPKEAKQCGEVMLERRAELEKQSAN